MNFKEKWELTDTKCETCGAIKKKQRGLTRQNVKRLLIPQWNMNEFLITFMLVMVLVLAYVYMNETQMCRDWIKNMTGSNVNDCKYSCEQKCELVYNPSISTGIPGQNLNSPNLTEFINKSNQLGG